MTRDPSPTSAAFGRPPPSACWLHQGLRSGFEVAYFRAVSPGLRVEGTTTGFQDGDPWVVTYRLELDEAWRTRRALVTTRTETRSTEQLLEADGEGHWRLDGRRSPRLDGCLDVDLEASAMTKTFPVHRLRLTMGQAAASPATYVRVTLQVERLHQRYERREDRTGLQTYDYEAPAFGFTSRLVYDRAGLVVDYPGIATRAG